MPRAESFLENRHFLAKRAVLWLTGPQCGRGVGAPELKAADILMGFVVATETGNARAATGAFGYARPAASVAADPRLDYGLLIGPCPAAAVSRELCDKRLKNIVFLNRHEFGLRPIQLGLCLLRSRR
jgi:hypothetical protein